MAAHRALNPEIFVRLRFPHPKLSQGGTTKKFNYKQIIKVLSSFAVIAMVLVASLTVPANAVTNIFYPKDNILFTKYDGNTETINYYFDTAPYLSLRENSSGNLTQGYNTVSIHGVQYYETYVFRVYPLGESFVPGRNITSSVIDVSDFKSRAVFNLSCDIEFLASYSCQPFASGDTSFYFRSTAYVCFYDINGTYIDQITTGAVRTDVVIEDIGNVEQNNTTFVLNVDIPLQIPEGAVYMAPCVLSYMYPPDYEAPHSISLLTASSNRFIMTADKNLLVENSETLQAIEDQLGDLNDKADTIINGTDDQLNNAQDGSEQVQQNQQEMDDILAQLDDYEKFDPTPAMQAIQSFLEEDGWQDVREVIAPVIDWAPTVTIMLIILSLINLSVILFGR